MEIKENDKITFILPSGEYLHYIAKKQWLKIEECCRNNKLFDDLSIEDKDELMSQFYGYLQKGGDWPEFNECDYKWFDEFAKYLQIYYYVRIDVNDVPYYPWPNFCLLNIDENTIVITKPNTNNVVAAFGAYTNIQQIVCLTHESTKCAFMDIGIDYDKFFGLRHDNTIDNWVIKSDTPFDDYVKTVIIKLAQYYDVIYQGVKQPKIEAIKDEPLTDSPKASLCPIKDGDLIEFKDTKGNKYEYYARINWLGTLSYINDLVFTNNNIDKYNFCDICYGYKTVRRTEAYCKHKWPDCAEGDYNALYRVLCGLAFIKVIPNGEIKINGTIHNLLQEMTLSHDQCHDLKEMSFGDIVAVNKPIQMDMPKSNKDVEIRLNIKPINIVKL